MTENAQRIADEMIEVLSRLAQMSASSAKLTDAVRSRDPASPLSARNAQQAIARLSRDLAELTGSAVGLLDPRGKQGSFATDSCRALQPALAKILDERRVAQDHDLQVARLEWLRLSTCLDRAALRIGAYQSHAERFIACAMNLLVTDFPWLDCQLHIEEDRGRTDGYAGRLRELFDTKKIDFMLVPRESERSHLQKVYTYSFRVIGHSSRLDQLRTGDNCVNVYDITGTPLILAPEGTSSRRRLQGIFLDAGIDMTSDFPTIAEEGNPAVMRMRAETGQGIAIMSDEYSTVGGSTLNFPYLARGGDSDPYQVEMGLLRHPQSTEPRHKAFDFVLQSLIKREETRKRAAAQA
jgi:hypothetical protein